MSAEVIEDHQVAPGARWFSVGAFELGALRRIWSAVWWSAVIRFAPVRLVLADPASCASGWIAAASRRAVTRCWVVEIGSPARGGVGGSVRCGGGLLRGCARPERGRGGIRRG